MNKIANNAFLGCVFYVNRDLIAPSCRQPQAGRLVPEGHWRFATAALFQAGKPVILDHPPPPRSGKHEL